jgi:tetratricopeptide (TPR) repeat protein
LMAGEQEIAVTVGDALATSWYNKARFVESLELCQEILAVFVDYRILGSIARAEQVLGFVDAAVDHYQQALDLCPDDELKEKATTLNNMAGVKANQGDIEGAIVLWQQDLEISERIGDVKGKAATLNNMAQVMADQGDIEGAIALWQQSLEIQERIGDVKGKAATLNNMAQVMADQGDIEGAIALWQQSLEIQERIGDVQGKAVTLANMAYVAGQGGDRPRQLALNLQAAQALGQVRAYGDLFTVLGNLGRTAEENPLTYLAQALWLSLKIQVPLASHMNLIAALFNAIPPGEALEALLAATANHLCQSRGERHPQLPQLQKHSLNMLMGAASAQGIATQEAIATWMSQLQLNDPAVFLPRLSQRLEEMVGEGWVFDQTLL